MPIWRPKLLLLLLKDPLLLLPPVSWVASCGDLDMCWCCGWVTVPLLGKFLHVPTAAAHIHNHVHICDESHSKPPHDAPVGQALLVAALACITSVAAALDPLPARKLLGHMQICHAALVKLREAKTKQGQHKAVK